MKKESKSQAFNMKIVYVIIAVVLVAAVIFFIYNPQNENKNIDTKSSESNNAVMTDNSAKVEVIEHISETDRWDERKKSISGKVQNTGSVDVYNVIITAKLYNINKKFIKTEFTRPIYNDLKAGQSSSFIISDIFEPFTSYELVVNWTTAK